MISVSNLKKNAFMWPKRPRDRDHTNMYCVRFFLSKFDISVKVFAHTISRN